MACGHLFCDTCGENYIQRDSPDRRPGFRGNITGFSPCPACGNPSSLDFVPRKNWKTLEKLFYKRVNDVRRGQWMITLATLHRDHGTPFKTVKKYFLIAAEEGGTGEGYSRLAQEYANRNDWVNVEKYSEKAAKLNQPVAINYLATKAQLGYFFFNQNCWGPQNPRDQSPVDVPRVIQLNRRAVKLLYPPACTFAAETYITGQCGVTRNTTKAYECAVLAAEKGFEPKAIKVLVLLAQAYNPDGASERAKAWIETNRNGKYGLFIRTEERSVQGLMGQMMR
ncbi:MAG: hypothetical protein SGARI_000628 [Bacillariaceae sp.]